LSFRPIPGWFTPPDASVLVYSGQTTAMGVTYVPVEINLTALQMRADGAFQFAFTNAEVRTFSAYGTTNLSQPFSNWTFLGHITEDGPGRFLFTDLQATNTPQRFYRVRREAYSPYGLNR
jgi:aminopeptidase N